jgi:filamentous hemagglutinin family protein
MSQANPTGAVVTKGAATVSSQGAKLTVQQTSQSAYINWKSFNIGAGETTSFVQPSSKSLVWNRINDANPSQILGNLSANGLVILQNTSGFYVGGQAAINTAGLIMTTSPSAPPEVFSGGAFDFSAPPPTAKIINYGEINAGAAGSVFLIAHDIENHGNISAPGGSIGLVAGKQVLLSQRPDGRGLSAQVTLPEGSVDNSGRLIADAGGIALRAQIVNQGGLVQANSVREHNGVIKLVASDSINLAPTSVISANGDSQGVSAGGSILIKSGDKFTDSPTSTVSVKGGAEGGNGGQVEISAIRMGSIQSVVDGRAAPGFLGGTLLIDPKNIILTNSGAAGSATILQGDPPDSLTLNVSSFASFSQILLQASQNITLGTAWNLTDSLIASTLTLQAGNNLILNNNLTAGMNWSVNLIAGADFVTATSVKPGVGNLTLSGNSTVQTQNGDIKVVVGNGVSIATGAIRTAAKGNINVQAVSGNVNAGRNPNGYTFRTTGYTVSPTLGGISTAAGGDVTISAGGNVTSFLPPSQPLSTSPSDAGSGAFGSSPGVVTVTAGLNPATGGNVFGHFVAADSERNGQFVASTITAHAGSLGQGGNVGSAGNALALSLIKGGWQVNAPNGSIFLQEVRNPNGVFNGNGSSVTPTKYLFDYDLHSFVDLEAGNAVSLLGTLLPRFGSDAVPILYPPTLTINAGPGGIQMGNNVTLFPSQFGELNITTTGGGSLTGLNADGSRSTLAMSDSGANRWTSTTDFAADHKATPVQLDNPNPVVFNISGNIEDINITTPKATHITVGDASHVSQMKNTSFSGQNLHEKDLLQPAEDETTFIHVNGTISNQKVYSLVNLDGDGLTIPVPRFPGDVPGYLTYLTDAVIPGSGPGSTAGGQLFPSLSFFYIPETKQIGYSGKMDAPTQNLLAGSLQVKTYTLDGKVALNADGTYKTKTISLGVDAQKMADLQIASQNSINPNNAPSGFKIGGPGKFDVTGASLDLGSAFGIISQGPAVNPSLAKLPGNGADISISVDGDLSMLTSQISSLYGGGINIFSGGSINVGLQSLPLSDPSIARGIWTSGHSDVNVVAHGDIDVAGSRIAAFAGGNIFVKSETGNVNAGNGGDAAVKVNTVVVNPVTGAVATPQQPISGSGILATTLPNAPVSQIVGNITIETPQGSINANQGGIVQEPLNGNTSLTPTVKLTAGTRDADGNVIFAGDINAGQSGVIGVNTEVNAAGNINGLFIARGDSTVNAANNVTGTFLAGGTANFNSGGNVSVLAIAGNAINIGSGTFQGIALSQNVSGGGANSALAATSTASTASTTAAAQADNTPKADATVAQTADDEEQKRRAARPLLARTTGRVTVILPKSN